MVRRLCASTEALVVETAPAEVRGRALGIYFFVTSLTTLLASLIAGDLWKAYGAAMPFYVSAAIAIVSATALLALGAVSGSDATP